MPATGSAACLSAGLIKKLHLIPCPSFVSCPYD